MADPSFLPPPKPRFQWDRLVVSLIGLPLLVAGIYSSIRQVQFLSRAEVVDGVVVEMVRRGSYYPVVAYQHPAGKEYRREQDVGSESPRFRIGAKVKVHVDPAEPESGRMGGFINLWLFPTFASGFGALLSLIGVGPYVFGRRMAREREIMMLEGEKVSAEIVRVAMNTRVKMFGRNPYMVVAQSKLGGGIQVFQSEDFWFDPRPYLDRKQVDVYFRPGRPEENYMDVSFINENWKAELGRSSE